MLDILGIARSPSTSTSLGAPPPDLRQCTLHSFRGLLIRLNREAEVPTSHDVGLAKRATHALAVIAEVLGAREQRRTDAARIKAGHARRPAGSEEIQA
ncbi:hypothetical protein C7T35_16825 [Variovorax sp. WS11]|nr:hypothetical protein C7T35_16825 [Variovorax sp. WS11]